MENGCGSGGGWWRWPLQIDCGELKTEAGLKFTKRRSGRVKASERGEGVSGRRRNETREHVANSNVAVCSH